MLAYLIQLVCLPTVYSLLSCKESCEACVAPNESNPPEVQKVYCSMCLECRGQRSKFEADMLLQESHLEAPALEAPVHEDIVEPADPDCPGGKCREHSKEGETEPSDNNDGGSTTCPTNNCQQIPTICITIPPWLCPTTTTAPTTVTACETTCKTFTECSGCGRRYVDEYRRNDQPDVYVAFPKGGNANGNYVYKKLKRGMRPDYL